MIVLEKKERAAPLERTIVRRSLVALNRLPDVRAKRNNTGKSPTPCRTCFPKLCQRCATRLRYPISFGLGEGGPDIIGAIRIRTPAGPIGVAFGIEVKRPEARKAHPEVRKLQEAWRIGARLWGILCEEVTSEVEAVAAVERFRAELMRRVPA